MVLRSVGASYQGAPSPPGECQSSRTGRLTSSAHQSCPLQTGLSAFLPVHSFLQDAFLSNHAKLRAKGPVGSNEDGREQQHDVQSGFDEDDQRSGRRRFEVANDSCDVEIERPVGAVTQGKNNRQDSETDGRKRNRVVSKLGGSFECQPVPSSAIRTDDRQLRVSQEGSKDPDGLFPAAHALQEFLAPYPCAFFRRTFGR